MSRPCLLPRSWMLGLVLLLSGLALSYAAAPVTVLPHPIARNAQGVSWVNTTVNGTTTRVMTTSPPNAIYDGPRYGNPNVNSLWEDLGRNKILGIGVAHIPVTDKYLMVGRTRWQDFNQVSPSQDVITSYYDLNARKQVNITAYSNTFCGGLAPMADGKICVVAGTGQDNATASQPNGMKGLRLYDPANPLFLAEQLVLRDNVVQQAAQALYYARWYPTITLMGDNSILVNGGTTTGAETGTPAQWYERFIPSENKVVKYAYDSSFYSQAGKIFYPGTWVLPTGDVFIMIDSVSRIMKPDYSYRTTAPGVYLEAPKYPSEYLTQFPRMGTPVMTALSYVDNYSSVEIIMFGGVPASNPCKPDATARTIAANPYSFRLKISWTKVAGDWVYTFGNNWVQEDMGIPRVGGDSVLLPNGDVVLLGGAQTGCSCGVVNGYNRGNYPALWTLLYQPDQPPGTERYTLMGASNMSRIYHGTSVLTTDGQILVMGSDAAKPEKNHPSLPNISTKDALSWISGGPDLGVPIAGETIKFWAACNDTRYQYGVELFSPPYFLDTQAKPKIISINGVTTDANAINVAYGGTITLTWAAFDSSQSDINVTSVSLVATSSLTHSFNSNQRVVKLEILSTAANTVTVKVPGDTAYSLGTGILPPQIYKIHVMNGKTYSRAWWVKLDQANVVLPAVPPPTKTSPPPSGSSLIDTTPPGMCWCPCASPPPMVG